MQTNLLELGKFPTSLFTDQINQAHTKFINNTIYPLLRVWQRYPKQCTQLYNELLHRFSLAHQMYDTSIPNHKQEPEITIDVLNTFKSPEYAASYQLSESIYKQIVATDSQIKKDLQKCKFLFFGYAPELYFVTNTDTEPKCEFTPNSIMWVLDQINTKKYYGFDLYDYVTETLSSNLKVFELTGSPLFNQQILWRRLVDAEYIIGSIFSEVIQQLPPDLY